MAETEYEIFQKEQSYRVRITHPACLAQEATGFATRLDAVAWIAQAKHLAMTNEYKHPEASARLRVVN